MSERNFSRSGRAVYSRQRSMVERFITFGDKMAADTVKERACSGRTKKTIRIVLSRSRRAPLSDKTDVDSSPVSVH